MSDTEPMDVPAVVEGLRRGLGDGFMRKQEQVDALARGVRGPRS